MAFDNTYLRSVKQLQLEGRLTDYRAGELKAMYVLRRRLFGGGALAVVVVWMLLAGQSRSWLSAVIVVALLAIPFLYCVSRAVALEQRISRVSERSSDTMDEFCDEFLAPYPELHQLFHKWRAEGPLWRHDEVRLTEVAQLAKLQETSVDGPAA